MAQQPSPSLLQTPSPATGAPADWKIFSSADYGYSLKYPPSWFDLGNSAAPDEQYFSTDKNAGSPSFMGSSDVFVGVSANCQYLLGAHPKLISQTSITVGGQAVQRYVATVSSSEGNLAAAMAEVTTGSYCYRFSMLTFTVQVVESHLADFDEVLSTVQFSNRTAPAVDPRPTAVPT